MSTFTQFHNWALGDVLSPAFLNGEIATIVTAGNNIDNTNIGAAGIFASQLIPTTGPQATFGGTQPYTFVGGEVVSSNNDANVPLAVQGNSATQSADLFQVFLNNGGTKEFSVDSAGMVHIGGTTGMRLSISGAHSNIIPATAGAPITFANAANTTNNVQIADTGALSVAPLINALNTLAPVAPGYTTAGAALAATAHWVSGTITATVSGSWTNGTLASFGGTNVVTLTNAAVFASASSYNVVFTLGAAAPNVIVFPAANTSGTQFSFFAYNSTGSTIGGGTTVPVNFYAVGT